ncbi:MAG: hypothetical protein FXF54_00150 [Kosmotoga sp.]|nr:MAG: hypothetical protein FXF54_00150 [Kosmotoga sp.]
MKKKLMVVTLVSLLLIGTGVFAFGPRWDTETQNTPAGNYRMRDMDEFEPQYLNREDSVYFSGEDIEFEGTVVEVKAFPTVFVVETEDGTVYDVHSGPVWLYEDVEVTVGSEVEITGKLITDEDGNFVVLTTITVDGKEIVIRDADGFGFKGNGPANKQAQQPQSRRGGFDSRGSRNMRQPNNNRCW